MTLHPSHPDPLRLAGACHHGCGCQLNALVMQGAEAAPREPDTLDAAETRALLVGAREAARVLFDNQHHLRRGRHAVIDSHARALRQLARCRAALAPRDLLRSAQLQASHSRKAAEEQEKGGRPHVAWLRYLSWPALIIVAVFDTWFFMSVFQYLSRTSAQAPWWEKSIAALPGVVLALALALVATMIATSLHNLRTAAATEHRRSRRAVGVLWAAVGVMYTVLLLATFGIWASLRAQEGGLGAEIAIGQARYPAAAVILLILMLTTTAVGIKVAAFQPRSLNARPARRQLAYVHWRHRRRLRLAQDAVVAHRKNHSDLRHLCHELTTRVRLQNVAVWESLILPARGLHRNAGTPILGEHDGPGSAEGSRPDGDDLADARAPYFRTVPQPRPDIGPLHEAQTVVQDCDPGVLQASLEKLEEELMDQLSGRDTFVR